MRQRLTLRVRSCRVCLGRTLPPRLPFQADTIQFQPVPLQPVAQLLGDPFLQGLDLGIDEFDHLAGREVDQMIVVVAVGGFIPRATIAELVLVQNPRLFEQLDRAIDRGKRDARIGPGGPGEQLFDIGVIRGLIQYPGDGAALVGQGAGPCPRTGKSGWVSASCPRRGRWCPPL